MNSILSLVMIINLAHVWSQELTPAVIVSKENGALSSKIVYFGRIGCNSSNSERTDKLEEEISELMEKFRALSVEFERFSSNIRIGKCCSLLLIY